jgi:catechol 2,3-dioxygenase-like lactoylglutathione lyase family enzyme
MAGITGFGGIFFRSSDPAALSTWYRDVLGLKVEEWNGAMLAYDAPGHPPCVVWAPFERDSEYFSPSMRDHMVNFGVEDLKDFLDQLRAKGVTILGVKDDDPNGLFAWILDPDGTKIELWEPKDQPSQ